MTRCFQLRFYALDPGTGSVMLAPGQGWAPGLDRTPPPHLSPAQTLRRSRSCDGESEGLMCGLYRTLSPSPSCQHPHAALYPGLGCGGVSACTVSLPPPQPQFAKHLARCKLTRSPGKRSSATSFLRDHFKLYYA